MERRRALQAIVFFSVAGNALISCKSKYEAVKKLGLKFINLNDDQSDLIDDMAKTIFPTASKPQFEGHTALPFVLSMVDGIYTKEERDKYLLGIKAFDEACVKTHQKSFVSLDETQKLDFLKKLNTSTEDTPIKHFFDVTKQQTVHYFMHTEKYLRGVQRYEMAPGRYKACLTIDQVQSKKL
jgi:hypothetical protein